MLAHRACHWSVRETESWCRRPALCFDCADKACLAGQVTSRSTRVVSASMTELLHSFCVLLALK
ncbi:unnamed protein product [Protopolystoma xenopodis]|uniref:Uncharacterized protein n=1 Tax=Protopolystoma xenopodis TaxID=117903 RepID=A0A448XQY9_9PLAT|nr:unnamed protein product [Protopolystoma xenopodis]